MGRGKRLLVALALVLAGCRSTEGLLADADREAARGNFAEASRLYQKAHQQDPAHPEVRGRLEIVRGRRAEKEPAKPALPSDEDGGGPDGGRRPQGADRP